MRKRGRPPIFENAMSNKERQQRKEQRKKQQFIQSMEAISELGGIMEQVLFLNVDGSDLPDRIKETRETMKEITVYRIVIREIKEIQENIRNSEYGLSAVDLHRSRDAVRQTSKNVMHLPL
ncbi:hypothetical protein A0U92_01110 [Acetobacter aceti]|uniref:Uncharacterized protein n=1 Tax=Acetobacter aceti TaxID=435 RepID=A0A1U9KCY9_ACEAC|nr:hypothetical protein [Acetobacter aceti]AQS83597.1 hypothetical protein A0U92_01110 [Acetobacter aceti]